MNTKLKKVLYSTTFSIALSFQSLCAQQTVQTETLNLDRPQGSLHKVSYGANNEVSKHLSNSKAMSAPTAQSKSSAWMMPWHFATSLFQPFIEDGAKMASTFKEEGNKIREEGLFSYVWNRRGNVGKSAFHVGKTLVENPLDTVSTVGGVLTGVGLSDPQGMLGATVIISNGLKNSQQLYGLAKSIKGKTYFEAAGSMALMGVALYAIASPVAEATQLVLSSSECQLDNLQSPISQSPICTTTLSNGNYATVWANSYNKLVGTIYNGNCGVVASEFLVSGADIPL